jgi:hypothetical protein
LNGQNIEGRYTTFSAALCDRSAALYREGAMPRGGKHCADGYSPYKHPDGRLLKLQKSSNSKTGYYCISKVGNLFYPRVLPKLKLDGVAGSKKQKLFGKGSKEPRDAAIILADYLDARYELPSAPPRVPHGSRLSPQRQKYERLEELMKEARGLLAMQEATAEEVAEIEAQAIEFSAWKAAAPRAARAAPPIVLQAVLTEPPAPPAPRWDAAVLEQVASIQAAAPWRA